MTLARNLLRSSAARTLFAVASTVVAFFMMPFLVRNLGERWYGIWVLITSLTGSYYLLDLGLATAVTRFVASDIATDDADGVNAVVNTSLVIYSALSLVLILVTVALAAVAHRFVPDASQLWVIRLTIVVVGIELAAEFPFKAFAGILSSYVRYDLLIYSRAIHLALSTTLIVYLVRHGAGIVALAATSFVCSQISNVYYFLVARHLFKPLVLSRRHVSLDVGKGLFSYSAWAFATQIANQVRFRIDSLVVGGLVSASAVTHYAVGQRLVETFVDLIYRATNMMMPVFTQYWVQGRLDEIREKLLLLTRINTILAVFGGGVIVIVGRAFILRWMGPSFGESYPVLVVLMIAMTTEVVGCYADNLFYAMSKHHYLAVINVVEGMLNLGLSVALVMSVGIAGAALGTALPLVAFRLAVIPYYVAKLVELPLWRYYANLLPTVGFTLLYLAGYYYLTRPFLEVPAYGRVVAVAVLAVPAYAVSIPFVAFSRAERRYLRSMIATTGLGRSRRSAFESAASGGDPGRRFEGGPRSSDTRSGGAER